MLSTIYCQIFSRFFALPVYGIQSTRCCGRRELADSRKLYKQRVLLKKVIRLLTNLRFLNPPSPRASQARLTSSANKVSLGYLHFRLSFTLRYQLVKVDMADNAGGTKPSFHAPPQPDHLKLRCVGQKGICGTVRADIEHAGTQKFNK